MDGVRDPLIGREIAGKFRVEAFIGAGAMGAVYRARQTALDKVIAVKVLHREYLTDTTFAARFQREAKAASRLDHPNSMRVIDFGEEPDGLLYIAMEYLDGRDLFHIIAHEYPLPPRRIVSILSQTLAALAVAHDMGVIHRDLKPENIMILRGIDDEGNEADIVKVCDFGIAKISDARTDGAGSSGTARLTAQGNVVGTPEYMSPEQGRGEKLDPRSDLYAVGIILYQMLTGSAPFEAETAIGVILKHVTDEPVRPSAVNPLAHPSLERVCLCALRKRREERFQSAREMRARLRAALTGEVSLVPDAISTPVLPPTEPALVYGPEGWRQSAASFAAAAEIAAGPMRGTPSESAALGAGHSGRPPASHGPSAVAATVAVDATPVLERQEVRVRREPTASKVTPGPTAALTESPRPPSPVMRWIVVFGVLAAGGAIAYWRPPLATSETGGHAPVATVAPLPTPTPPASLPSPSPSPSPSPPDVVDAASVPSPAPSEPPLAAPPAQALPSSDVSELAAHGSHAKSRSQATSRKGKGKSVEKAEREEPTRSASAPPAAASGAARPFVLPDAGVAAPAPPALASSGAAATGVAPPAPPTAAAASASTPPATPVTASSGAPPQPPSFNPNTAKIDVGRVTASNGANANKIRNALLSRVLPNFTQCYQKGLRAKGAKVGGDAVLSLNIDGNGRVVAARLSGAVAVPPIGGCVEMHAKELAIQDFDALGVTAQIELLFKPE